MAHSPKPARSARGTRVKRAPVPTFAPTPSRALNTVSNSSSPVSNASSNASACRPARTSATSSACSTCSAAGSWSRSTSARSSAPALDAASAAAHAHAAGRSTRWPRDPLLMTVPPSRVTGIIDAETPRAGEPGHAAFFGVQSGCRRSAGPGRQRRRGCSPGAGRWRKPASSSRS